MLNELLKEQKRYFRSNRTLDIDFRIGQLAVLKHLVLEYEDRIIEAVKNDIGRPETEIYTSEILTVVSELHLMMRNLRKWARPERVKTPLLLRPGRSSVRYEPFGSVLIMAPWNYPFQLLMAPLAGAVSAGNCAVVKPSEVAGNTAEVINQMIGEGFESRYICPVQGGPETARELLKQDFDSIFFTGNSEIGRAVMKAAAEKMIPVTLELGGKCPCIVTENVSIKKAARRITWGKYFNAGQTCLAPDYVCVHRSVRQELIEEIATCIEEFYGQEPAGSPDYGRIINEKHFDRIMHLAESAGLTYNNADRNALYIPPGIVQDAGWDDEIMTAEIFGPLLPVLGYSTLEEVIGMLDKRPKPLALYLFSSDRKTVRRVMKSTRSGGVTVNDVLIQAASGYLPFGGVGLSGMGRYRGKSSFLAFSNPRSVMKRGLWPDWKFRYPPYRYELDKLKKFLRYLSGTKA